MYICIYICSRCGVSLDYILLISDGLLVPRVGSKLLGLLYTSTVIIFRVAARVSSKLMLRDRMCQN